MAKANKSPANGTSTGTAWPEVNLSSVWGSGIKIPVDLAWRIAFSECVDVPGLPSPWDPRNPFRDKLPVIVGMPGLSKTSMFREICHRNGIDFGMLEFSGTQTEDNLPITLNMLDEKGQPVRRGYGKMYEKPAGRRPFGVILVNEVLGADISQQQQLRAFLSNRELAGVKIDPGWILVADTNPATSDFMGNKVQDASVEARCFFLPVRLDFQDWMNYSGGNSRTTDITLPEQGKPVPVTPYNAADGSGGMYEPLYLFLRMCGGDAEEGYWHATNPRRWTMIGNSLARQASGGLVTREESMRWLSLVLPEKVAGAFGMFLAKGDDPDEYPIPGHKLMRATAEEMAVYVKRIKGWETHTTRNPLIGFTVLEAQGYLRARDKLDAEEKKNLSVFLRNLNETRTVQVVESLSGAISDQAWEVIQADPSKQGKIEELLAWLDRTNAENAAPAASKAAPIKKGK